MLKRIFIIIVLCVCFFILALLYNHPKFHDDDFKYISFKGNNEYDLTFKSLAHWFPDKRSIRAVLFVDKIAIENKTIDKHSWNNNTEFDCFFCDNYDCHEGIVKTSFASEERDAMDRGMRNFKYKLSKSSVKTFHGAKAIFRTMYLKCEFDDRFKHKHVVDGKMLIKVKGTVIEVPIQNIPKWKNEQSEPIVCGRSLAGTIDSKYIKLFVENNIKNGFSKTLIYDMGQNYLQNKVLLEQQIKMGNLIIIDMKEILQQIYFEDAPFLAVFVKAFAQWFSRIDCLNRVRPLNPSWIINLDIDEYVVPTKKDQTLKYMLSSMSASPFSPASIMLTTHVPNDSNYVCKNNDMGDYFDYVMKHEPIKAKLKQKGEGLVKYAYRPFLNENYFAIHYIRHYEYLDFFKPSGHFEKKLKTKAMYIRHNRCVNNELARQRWWRLIDI